MKLCGDSSIVELPLFQGEDGGATPTSPHQLLFRQISLKTSLIAYKKWHYLKDIVFLSQINFGCYFDGVICGAISYGPPNATELKGYWNRHNQKGWLEIKRLVMSPICPKNSESRFIGYTIKYIKKMGKINGIVTYADDAQGHKGTIYRATGFLYLGKTEGRKDFWVNEKIQQRGKTKGVIGEWRPRSAKHLFIKDFRNS